MPNNNRTYTMDPDTDAIMDQIPEKQKSAFVRDAVKLKARTLLGDEKPQEKPRVFIIERKKH